MFKNVFLSSVAVTLLLIIPVSANCAVTAERFITDQGVIQSLPNNLDLRIPLFRSSGIKADGDQDRLRDRDRLRDPESDCVQTKDCDRVVDSETNPDPDREREQDKVIDPQTDPDRERDRIVDPDVEQDRDQERIIDPPNDPIQDTSALIHQGLFAACNFQRPLLRP